MCTFQNTPKNKKLISVILFSFFISFLILMMILVMRVVMIVFGLIGIFVLILL